jgi:hypothetical protein
MSKFNSGIGLKKQRPKGQFSASGPGGSKFAQFPAHSGEDRSLYRWSWRLLAWSETINGLKVPINAVNSMGRRNTRSKSVCGGLNSQKSFAGFDSNGTGWSLIEYGRTERISLGKCGRVN